jgi:hypothetical protein
MTPTEAARIVDSAIATTKRPARAYSAASFSTGRAGGLKSGGSTSKRTGSALSGELKGSRMRLKPAAIWGLPVS